MRVRFLRTCVTKEADPQTFVEGKEYDLSPPSVDRWERRGMVEVLKPQAAAVIMAAVKPASVPTEPPKVETAVEVKAEVAAEEKSDVKPAAKAPIKLGFKA